MLVDKLSNSNEFVAATSVHELQLSLQFNVAYAIAQEVPRLGAATERIRWLILVTALPPLLTVKFIVSEVDVVETEVIAGANGVVNGVVADPLTDAPKPAAFTSRICGE